MTLRRDPFARPAAFEPARPWLGLALGVLVLAGVLSLLLVVGRMPPFDRLVRDPLFFKRCLVVHVNLALVVWFHAFVAGLAALIAPGRPRGAWTRVGFPLAALGTAAMVASAFVPGAAPILANYVPAVDHPVFHAGQIAFGAGVVASFADARLWPRRGADEGPLPSAVVPGVRAAAIALLFAAITFATSRATTPAGLPPAAREELARWGGGHVLQASSAIAMAASWIGLVAGATGRLPLSRAAASAVFAALLCPWTLAPLLASRGTQSVGYLVGFTRLMEWTIVPGVAVVLVVCAAALVRARREGRLLSPSRDPRVTGFAASAALTLLGFVLGALVRDDSTMVPGHYHASIGGVTAAFMATSYVLGDALGLRLPGGRLGRAAAWQPVVYGAGQAVFAVGFSIAGAHGMLRKAYGAEQAGRGIGGSVGLAVMGLGGVVAVAGGVLFLWIAIAAWAGARARAAAPSPADLPEVPHGVRP